MGKPGIHDPGNDSSPSNYNFENDLQSNEISLQDMQKRLNLRNELIDDVEEPMLGGNNAANNNRSQPSSEQKGKAAGGAKQGSAKLQKFEDQ